MTEAIFIKPFLALILTCAISSLLGVFVLWKKLSYFGDAISHSILLGAALGTIFNLQQDFSLIIFAIFFALLVGFMAQNRYFSKDTIITISSYFCITLAIILNDLSGKNLDFSEYIFGDLSSVESLDIVILTAILIGTIVFAILANAKILLINLAKDLATVEGINNNKWNNIFLVLLTLTVAISVKIVGILLVTALLVLPAAIARIFAKSPQQMLCFSAIIAVGFGALSSELANQLQVSLAAFTIFVFCLIFIFSLLIKNASS
jgi:zinc transport system permease protein